MHFIKKHKYKFMIAGIVCIMSIGAYSKISDVIDRNRVKALTVEDPEMTLPTVMTIPTFAVSTTIETTTTTESSTTSQTETTTTFTEVETSTSTESMASIFTETTTVLPTTIRTEPITQTVLEQSTYVSTQDTTASEITEISTTYAEESVSSIETEQSEEPSLTYLGNFRGTYYRGEVNPCRGGSGRTLISCAYGSGSIKGSVACKYIYSHYGYNVNGRTTVYIESDDYPTLNGWYYVDDCCASNSVVDFYYPNYSECPFRIAGNISVRLYI